jgi:hypothetical protein
VSARWWHVKQGYHYALRSADTLPEEGRYIACAVCKCPLVSERHIEKLPGGKLGIRYAKVVAMPRLDYIAWAHLACAHGPGVACRAIPKEENHGYA